VQSVRAWEVVQVQAEGECRVSVKIENLIRRNCMAFAGANYECKLCGDKFEVDRDVDYTERDAKAAAEHECKS
jgi:hypothetical protein